MREGEGERNPSMLERVPGEALSTDRRIDRQPGRQARRPRAAFASGCWPFELSGFNRAEDPDGSPEATTEHAMHRQHGFKGATQAQLDRAPL